jgi:hypothetical protein
VRPADAPRVEASGCFFGRQARWLRMIAAALRADEEKLLKHCRMMEESFRDVYRLRSSFRFLY